jgi:M6 family metalloprotease-like protein
MILCCLIAASIVCPVHYLASSLASTPRDDALPCVSGEVRAAEPIASGPGAVLPLSSGVTLVQMYPGSTLWTMQPYTPGLSVLEQYATGVYGDDGFGTNPDGVATLPSLPVTGAVTVPVFLVDWGDFDPVVDPSNPGNPQSIFGPGYVQKTPTEISAYLNGPEGPAGYYSESSGGLLDIDFAVHGWIRGDSSEYLGDYSDYYDPHPTDSTQFVRYPNEAARDVLRAAVAELGIDLRQYDSDGNGAIDGFVLLYEGQAGFVLGASLSWTNGSYEGAPWYCMALDNVTDLVDPSDENYALFQSQPLLYSRYVGIPEQIATPPGFRPVGTWVHELGHLLLGYRDYYFLPTSLGEFALSALYGGPHPHQPSVMEKHVFAHWVPAPELTADATRVVQTGDLVAPEGFDPASTYVYKVLVDDDPMHYILLENRHLLPQAQGGSYWNDASNPAESGLIVFEVNRHLLGTEQIRRHIPRRLSLARSSVPSNLGAFRPGDVFDFVDGSSTLFRIDSVSEPSDSISFRVSFNPVDSYRVDVLNPPGQANQPFNVSVTALDQEGQPLSSSTEAFSLTAWEDGSGALFTLGPQGDVWDQPLDMWNYQHRVQMIYPAQWLEESGAITSMALNILQLPGNPLLEDFTIRMKHTSNSAFATGSWESGFTTLYQDDVVLADLGWVSFELQTPFEYNGVDNIMIDLSFKGLPFTADGRVSGASDFSQRMVYLVEFGDFGDPTTWVGSSPMSFTAGFVPDLKLQFGRAVSCSVSTPTVLAGGTWSGSASLGAIGPGVSLRAEDTAGIFGVNFGLTSSTPVGEGGAVPRAFLALDQNRPNPFGKATSIRFSLPRRGPVALDIYDITGRATRSLVTGELTAGDHEVTWDGTLDSGQRAAQGVYFYKLRADGEQRTRSLLLLR